MPPSQLAKKLVDVMKSVDRVPKNGYNDYHRYSYCLEADIMDAVRGKLAELGILLTTSVESTARNAGVTEVHTLHTFIDTESGETLPIKGYGQGQDSGDKGGYKAITGSCKYFILKTFLIPTGDDPENDDKPPAAPRAAAKLPARAAAKPATNGTKPNGQAKPNGTSRAPNQSTPAQQNEIKKLSKELGLDVDEIMAKMSLQWPPPKDQAERILRRLHEKKSQSARK